MKKAIYKLFILTVVISLASCSSNELPYSIDSQESLLKSYKLNRDASGRYSLDYTVSKKTIIESIKNSKSNSDEILLYLTEENQPKTTFNQGIVVTGDQLLVGFNDTHKNERTSITVFDDNITFGKGDKSVYLKEYTIENNGDNSYTLDFKVNNNVSVSFEYNNAEDIYEIHLADSKANKGNSYTQTFTKESGNKLKIDFVNYYNTSQNKNETTTTDIERKPRVIIDTFSDDTTTL